MELTKHGHACVVLERRGPPARHRPGCLHRAGGARRRDRRAHHPRARRPLRAASGCGRRSTPTPRWRCGRTRRWPGSSRGSAARVHVVGHGDAVTVAGFDVHVHGELHARDPPGDPADRERRVPGRRSGLPSRRRADRAGRAGRDAAAAGARALVEGGGGHRLRARRARRPGVRRARRAAQRHRPRARRRAAGRAGAGHAHARTAGWPRGTRSSSDARPGPPGIGSADGAVVRGRRAPSATPISSTAAITAMMKPTTFSSQMPVFGLEQAADEPADDAPRRRRTAA